MTKGIFAAFSLVLGLATGACGGDDGGEKGGVGSGGAGGAGGSGGAGGAFNCVDTGEHALPRAETFSAYDSKRNRVVFFGGDIGVPVQCNPAPKPIGEMWTYDVACKSFAQVAASGGPGPRARGLAVYDPEGDRMIVFGGRYREASSGPYTVYSDVWALDLESLTW